MSKRLEDMDEVELHDVMTRAGRAVESVLPPGRGPRGKAMFVLVAFDDAQIAQYVCNCRRSDMIQAMRETADRLEAREDVPR